MNNIINSYKEISTNILAILSLEHIDNDKLDKYLEERKILLESIHSDDKELFIEKYKVELKEIDVKISELLDKSLTKSKRELANYRRNLRGNTTYLKANKIILNIFSKKV